MPRPTTAVLDPLVAVGIGAALVGMRPICEIQFADYIFPAFNQIVNEAAMVYYRTGGDWHVPMVIRAPYGGGIGAVEHGCMKGIRLGAVLIGHAEALQQVSGAACSSASPMPRGSG